MSLAHPGLPGVTQQVAEGCLTPSLCPDDAGNSAHIRRTPDPPARVSRRACSEREPASFGRCWEVSGSSNLDYRIRRRRNKNRGVVEGRGKPRAPTARN